MQISSIHNLFMPTIWDLLTKNKCWVNHDLLHKPHNAPVPYPTMYQHIAVSVAKSCILGYLFDALWNLWDRSINSLFYYLTAFTNKKSRRNDSHIGFNKRVQIDDILSRGSYQNAIVIYV